MMWILLTLLPVVLAQRFEIAREECYKDNPLCGQQTIAASRCLTPCFNEAQGCFRKVGTVILKIQQCMLDLGEEARTAPCNQCVKAQMDRHCDEYFAEYQKVCGKSVLPVPTQRPTSDVCLGLNRKKCAEWSHSCAFDNATKTCIGLGEVKPVPTETPAPEPNNGGGGEEVCDRPCGSLGKIRKADITDTTNTDSSCECLDFCQAVDGNMGYSWKIPKTKKQKAQGGPCTCYSGKKGQMKAGKKGSIDVAGFFGY